MMLTSCLVNVMYGCSTLASRLLCSREEYHKRPFSPQSSALLHWEEQDLSQLAKACTIVYMTATMSFNAYDAGQGECAEC